MVDLTICTQTCFLMGDYHWPFRCDGQAIYWCKRDVRLPDGSHSNVAAYCETHKDRDSLSVLVQNPLSLEEAMIIQVLEL